MQPQGSSVCAARSPRRRRGALRLLLPSCSTRSSRCATGRSCSRRRATCWRSAMPCGGWTRSRASCGLRLVERRRLNTWPSRISSGSCARMACAASAPRARRCSTRGSMWGRAFRRGRCSLCRWTHSAERSSAWWRCTRWTCCSSSETQSCASSAPSPSSPRPPSRCSCCCCGRSAQATSGLSAQRRTRSSPRGARSGAFLS
mmetsp:Transcript_45857/g.111691  ORF Transcript_45857/g.111691 Transcript_45857/m.111691 type:complete len:202 (+) Transcript_45857:353-958(+)